jgi:hypothetical protein
MLRIAWCTRQKVAFVKKKARQVPLTLLVYLSLSAAILSVMNRRILS